MLEVVPEQKAVLVLVNAACQIPSQGTRTYCQEQGPGISVFNKCPDATGGRGGDRNLGTRLLELLNRVF